MGWLVNPYGVGVTAILVLWAAMVVIFIGAVATAIVKAVKHRDDGKN